MRTRRQRLGQHFLRDAHVAAKVAAALDAEPARVLEIGAGRGALTRPLLARFGQVRALELDRGLAAGLAARLGHPGALEVREADALAGDLDALAAGGPWQVAANLPYSVGTAIVRRLLPRHDLFTCLVVMVQLEVAERLIAGAGERRRGLLSLEVEAYAAAELLFTVPPSAFSPPPRVTSAVVRLRLRPAAPRAALAAAFALGAAAFGQRRKTIANSLAAVADASALAAAWPAAGVMPSARPQELSLDHWLALGRALPGPAAAGRGAGGR